MEYQPLILRSESTLPEPYLNEGGSFLTLPSEEQVMEFLLNEAKSFIAWKDGGEAAQNKIIYPSDYNFSSNDEEGHVIIARDDGHGYNINLNTLNKGIIYSDMVSVQICHFIYIANARKVTLPTLTENVERNQLMYNYDTLIEELKSFDISKLRSINDKQESIDSDDEIIFDSSYDSETNWDFTSTSTTSSEYNDDYDDLEMARIPTPPPAPEY